MQLKVNNRDVPFNEVEEQGARSLVVVVAVKGAEARVRVGPPSLNRSRPVLLSKLSHNGLCLGDCQSVAMVG